MTVEIIETAEGQYVLLPESFRFTAKHVCIRREGNAVVLEPEGADSWPEGFFESIRIDDPAFQRPDQGITPDIQPLSE